MTDPNPYESPLDVNRQPTDRSRVRAMILSIVLLDVAFSAYKVVRNLPDLFASPDSTAIAIGGVLVLWIAWIVVELVAALLVWRGQAAGRWILVASFGLKALGQVGALAMLSRIPTIVLSGPWLYLAIQAACYCGAAGWLLFFPRFEDHAVCEKVACGQPDSEQLPTSNS
jgi:hypothetical protein